VAPRIESRPQPQPARGSGANSSIVVSRVRWGEQTDAYRAVIDISGQTGVEIKEYPGRFDVVFSPASTSQFSETSPWNNLSVESSNASGSAILSFKHAATRVKSFWVLEPPRYVVDFFFGGAPLPSAGAAKDDAPEDIKPGAIPTISTQPSLQPAGSRKYVIVVDAGHGGHDPGAVGNKLREKDLNLKAALDLASSLKSLGLEVKLTRADDRYLKLAERTAFANSANADVFISLHCNALPRGQHASGMELYLMDQPTDRAAFNLAVLENRESSGEGEYSAEENAESNRRTELLLKILRDMLQNDKVNESTSLAEFLYNKARGGGFSLRKVRQAPFFVLRGAEMPALLIEMGYITEASDAKNLNSQAYRKKMMDSVAAGIRDYLKSGPIEGGR
jgi:N-acetylmuramoyl-L-alanine amidase